MDKQTLFSKLDTQRIETPSWGYADSGTRFGKFCQPNAAKTLLDKLQDAGQVHKYTGICPLVALHIPWDKPENGDWAPIQAEAASHNIAIGTINPNVFQDQCYKWGSFSNTDPAVRQKALEHHLECIEIAKVTQANGLSLWYADGTNYPGQGDFRQRRSWFKENLQKVAATLPEGLRMIVEYKFFEPAFYHTDLADWGQSLMLCQACGPQAQVLVDTGHHATGTNIEHIVATLLQEGRLGGFHFNGRKYADDDLTVGSINPYEMFLIYNELVAAEMDGSDPVAQDCARNVMYMFDQSHNLKNKIEATIQSTLFVQEMFAKALLVDREALAAARMNNDVMQAEECLRDAYNTDVRPLLEEWRSNKGLEPKPLQAFRASGYSDAVAKQRSRAAVAAASGGYQ
jgi:L-rhamnose isomerase / sugar isomerase